MKRRMPIFYSALLLTCVNLLLRLVSTSFQVYLSGRIGAAGIGLMQLVSSVGAMSVTAGMAGIRTATMYLTAAELGRKNPGSIRWVLSGCLLYSILVSGGVSFCLYFFAPQLAEHWIGDVQTERALRLYASFVPVICLCGVMSGYFTAANRIGTLAAIEVLEQFVCMGVTVAMLSFWAGSDPINACNSVISGSGISICLTTVLLGILRIREKVPPGPRIPVAKHILHTAVPLAMADDLKAGISTTENLMVPKRLALYPGTANPLAAVGIVCGMVFPVLMFPAAILFGLNELLIPELARCNAAGSQTRICYLVRRGLKVALIYGCIFGGLEFLIAAPLCQRLYSSAEAGQFLRLYAPLIPMLYCDALTDAMTKGLGQQRICVRYNILTSAMDVLFLFLLLPRYGMIGYYVSFLITHLLNFCLSLRRLMKITGLRIPAKRPIAAAIATISSVFIATFVPLDLLKCALFLALVFSLLFLLGVLEREDIMWLRGILTSAKRGR